MQLIINTMGSNVKTNRLKKDVSIKKKLFNQHVDLLGRGPWQQLDVKSGTQEL